jgi:hypothetical protein
MRNIICTQYYPLVKRKMGPVVYQKWQAQTKVVKRDPIIEKKE